MMDVFHANRKTRERATSARRERRCHAAERRATRETAPPAT
jgi:hypothetical protein